MTDVARRVKIQDDVSLTPADVQELVGFPIIIEGGIAQGKTSLARAIERLLARYGVNTVCFPEPTDEEALAEFMKYQVAPPTEAGAAASFAEGRAAAAKRMQESMMRRRSDLVRAAAEFAKSGVAIIDRGPFGDTTFMTQTYRKYGVSENDETAYVIEFLSRYLRMPFPKRTFLILRVRAPVAVTYARYVERERAVAGNKYSPEYLQGIEDAHDACTRAWGSYVLYDNGDVPFVRPPSPVDESGKKAHGSPDEKAVKCVVAELCKLAKELNNH